MATTPTTSPDVEPPVAAHPGRRLSEDEFVEWAEGFEKVRAEWIDGEVIVMSPVNLTHLRLSEFLFRILVEFAEARNLGEIHGPEFVNRFRVGPRLMRRLPDLWFVASGRLHLLQPSYLDGPPDLAVEVVSPDSIERDYHEKFSTYQAAGVREYWIIDPLEKILQAFRLDPPSDRFQALNQAEGRIDSEVLPGFFLRSEWLWRAPLPKVSDLLRELGV